MKSLVTLCFTMIFTASSLAQEARSVSNHTADFLIRNYRIENSERTIMQPGYSINWGMHNVRVAPMIQIYTSEARNLRYRPELTGLSLAYQIQIPSKFNFLDQHFELESGTQLFHTEWEVNENIGNGQNYRPIAVESREFFQSFTLGYGFVIRPFGDHFFMRQTSGVGMFFSKISGGAQNDEVDFNGRIDFRGYDDFEALLNISAGLGWRF